MNSTRLPVLRLTDRAVERVKTLIAAADRPVLGVRVGVKNSGCAGMSYTFDYTTALEPGDEVITSDGATVVVSAGAVLFLLGAEMDFQADKLSAQFVFANPNETASCGCGESVTLAAASLPAE